MDLLLVFILVVGDSVVLILEEMGLEFVGIYGIIVVLVLLNDVVKKGGVMVCNYVGGLLGVFILVFEDVGMIKVVEEGYLNLEKLEVMIVICLVGLDMIVILGDILVEMIVVMIVDEVVIGVINYKIMVVWIIFVKDKKVGDFVEFGGLLGIVLVMWMNLVKLMDFI